MLALLVLSSTAIGQTTPASRPSPAAVPVQPASDAGAIERRLAPVQPGHPGVTQRVQNANTHDVDAQGHTLDPHGRPVGQAVSPPIAPVAASTVH